MTAHSIRRVNSEQKAEYGSFFVIFIIFCEKFFEHFRLFLTQVKVSRPKMGYGLS